MSKIRSTVFLAVYLFTAAFSRAQPYFLSTAAISGNSIVYKIKAVNGSITTGWSDIEFFFRNPNGAPNADAAFSSAVININTSNFPGISIPYNGSEIQGTEDDYTNYWFGISFTSTTPQTYTQNQEYTVCTITLGTSPADYLLELCHNEPFFSPHYVALTGQGGNDLTNLTGTCKFYGPGAIIHEPDNCPITTPGNNHILPLNGPLPVELLDFQVSNAGPHHAVLHWETASEINFQQFEVERLHEINWRQLGTVKAAGNNGGRTAYAFDDPEVPGTQVYYRLKILDFDGSFSYSPIRDIRFEDPGDLSVYPNPAVDKLYLRFNDAMPELPLSIKLVDRSGRTVWQHAVDSAPGVTRLLELPTGSLPAGSYLFGAESGHRFRFSKPIVIVQQH